MENHAKIVVTGAAGFVGFNLIFELLARGYTNIVAMDRHVPNLRLLKDLYPSVHCLPCDFMYEDSWTDVFDGASILYLLHAESPWAEQEISYRNAAESMARIVKAGLLHKVSYTVFVGCCAYRNCPFTQAKQTQETLLRTCGLAHCIVRPARMFGWFEREYLATLAYALKNSPYFPVPGEGRVICQPLYVRDVCRILVHLAEEQPERAVYNLAGAERIAYRSVVEAVRDALGVKTIIQGIEEGLLKTLTNQPDAVITDEYYTGVDMQKTFGVPPTPFKDAVRETFTHPLYSRVERKG